MVGYAERASWKMDLPAPPMASVDSQLREQLRKLVNLLELNDGELEPSALMTKKINLDGYEIVDLANNEIVDGGYWLPVYLPTHVALPLPSILFRLHNRDLYVLRIDQNDRLLTASAQEVGNIWSMAALLCLLFLTSGIVAYFSARRFFRKYFAFGQLRPEEVERAVELGECTSIEFKRGISTENLNLEQILQTVAAFANTEDGTLFVGVDDDAKIKGIKIDNPKQKDQLAQKVHQIIRQRIKPAPWVQVDFPAIRGLTVCRIFVPRGEEPLYFLDGVIYVRYGPADVKAEPQIVKRLLAMYAL